MAFNWTVYVIVTKKKVVGFKVTEIRVSLKYSNQGTLKGEVSLYR